LRQKPIDNFFVDFFCFDLMLAIEIDGQTHDHKISQDIARQKRIESLGITVLRFLAVDVKRNMAGVLETIDVWIEKFEMSKRP
jgi:very-short-patch-repair endonuclease